MTNILAISNVHGRFNELHALLGNIHSHYNFEEFDQVIFMGDYIGYGDQNEQVIRFLMDLKKTYPHVTLLQGHWEMLLWQNMRLEDQMYKEVALKHFEKEKQLGMLLSLKQNETLVEEWLNEIENMKWYCIEKDFIFTHAGIDLSQWKKDMDIHYFMEHVQEKHDMVWATCFQEDYILYWTNKLTRNIHIFEPFPYKVVFGHVPIHQLQREAKETTYTQPFHLGNVYGIDFGAYSSEGSLGAVIFQDNGIKTYVEKVKNLEEMKKIEEAKEIS